MPEITLKPISKDNWRNAVELDLQDDQRRYILPNAVSLVQAHYQDNLHAQPLGIYAGDDMVGFMLSADPDESPYQDTVFVMRFMIGADHQRKGYGKAAMHAFIEQTKRKGVYRHIVLSYVPDNEIARKLYASVGFVEKGIREEWGGEMEAMLVLGD